MRQRPKSIMENSPARPVESRSELIQYHQDMLRRIEAADRGGSSDLSTMSQSLTEPSGDTLFIYVRSGIMMMIGSRNDCETWKARDKLFHERAVAWLETCITTKEAADSAN